MTENYIIYQKGIPNQFPLLSISHVTTGGITVATAIVIAGGAFKAKSGPNGSVYSAYRDLWERLNDGQIGLTPSLTAAEIGTLSDIDDGVQIINKTTGREEICIGGIFTNTSGEAGGLVHLPIGTVSTTDNTPTTVKSVTIPIDTLYQLTAEVDAELADHTVAAVFTIKVGVKRLSTGNALLVGTASIIFSGKDGGAASWTVDFTVSGNDVRVTVTGANGTNINWDADLHYLKI